MAFIRADRVKDTTTTTGTGAVTVSGTAPTGFRTFSAVCATNDTVSYCIVGGAEWEVGIGTYSATNEITRTTILASSNGGSAVNFSAGTKDVFVTKPAGRDVDSDQLASTAANLGASLVGVEDAGGYFTGTTVEAALAELGADVAALDQAVVLKGTWDASAGSFPGSGSAQAGWSYIVSVGGTVDSVAFAANDRIVAITDNASTTTFAANWHKLDYTDQVLSVAGQTGAVTLAQADVSGLATSDSPQFAALNIGHESDTTVTRSAAGVIAVEGAVVKMAGRETIWIPAASMIARTTNGAASGLTELATNDIMLKTLDFDTTTEEGAGFWVAMPKSWNESTVVFKAFWTAASGSGGVAFGLAARAHSNDDAMDQAVSGQQIVTDTLITANDMHITSESSAITIGGTPAEGDVVYFEVTREVGNASDTLAVDAKLIGLHLYITTNATNDQ